MIIMHTSYKKTKVSMITGINCEFITPDDDNGVGWSFVIVINHSFTSPVTISNILFYLTFE